MNEINRFSIRRIIIVSVWFGLVCVAFVIGPKVYAQDQLEKTTVVYGGSPWLGHYPVWIGIKKGFFKKKKLDVSFQTFHASSDRMGAMLSDDVDFASTGATSAIALMAVRQKSFYIVGMQDSYATVEGIIARKNIKTVADLKGKKMAVTFASSGHVLALDILQQFNIDPYEDIDLINMKVSEMPSAFMSGEIDAAAVWTPFFDKLLNLEDSHELVNDTSFSLYKQYGGLVPGPDMIAVRAEFADQYPLTTHAFLQAYFESVEYLKSHPTESAKVLLDLTQLNLDEQLKVLADVEWHGLDEQLQRLQPSGLFVKGLQRLAEFLKEHNQIDRVPQVKKWLKSDLLPLLN